MLYSNKLNVYQALSKSDVLDERRQLKRKQTERKIRRLGEKGAETVNTGWTKRCKVSFETDELTI